MATFVRSSCWSGIGVWRFQFPIARFAATGEQQNRRKEIAFVSFHLWRCRVRVQSTRLSMRFPGIWSATDQKTKNNSAMSWLLEFKSNLKEFQYKSVLPKCCYQKYLQKITNFYLGEFFLKSTLNHFNELFWKGNHGHLSVLKLLQCVLRSLKPLFVLTHF